MALDVYNTLTGKKEPFTPLRPPEIRMYVCGLTPYEEAHIGHARAYVAYDVMRRFLEAEGFRVDHIQNITDVDDRIIARSQQSGEAPLAYAQRIHDVSVKAFDELRIKRPRTYPKVSEHIDGIIEMTETLIRKGHAYAGQDDHGTSVYFSVASDPDYGKLSHLNRDELLQGVRKDVAEGKRDAADFALWKAAKPGEVSWDSPWGKGRPGWHIECSVMTKALLGETLDIHGGGWDLVFPHHENELAQSESANDAPFVRYWLHVGFLTVEGTKMSKSLGNFVTLRDALKKYRPEVLRLWLAGTHYRSPIDYSEAGLAQAAANIERIENMLSNVEAALAHARTGPATPADEEALRAVQEARRERFLPAMRDDFNTPVALSVLLKMVGDLNKYAAAQPHKETLEKMRGEFEATASIFAILPEAKKEDVGGLAEDLMALLLDVRQMARTSKQYAMSDRIRDGLLKLGIVIEDTDKGPRWKRKA
ncbi:MAG TPA: cysteine--tRNA ligase [Candidatus Thermoplasmatota archaeon]|nr:cysteine--tRNA ligase [Candidatus Thermoplasmatota archaeon]